MGKPSRVEPEFVQRLRQRAARFSDLDLTLVEWASVENAVDSFTRRTMAAMRPGALELVRRTIFSAETNQLERDRSQLEASLTAEFRVAAALESEVVAATLEARTRAGRLLSDLNAELAATQSRLDDLEVDHLRLTHLLAATRRRGEIVEADNRSSDAKAQGQ